MRPAFFLRYRCFLLLIACPICLPRYARSQAPATAAARAAVVAPFIDEQALLVGRIDLQQIDPAAAVKLLTDVAPEPDRAKFARQAAEIEQKAKAGLRILAQAGISELYAVVSLADMPKEPAFVVAPVQAGHDPQQAAAALRQLLSFEAADVRPGVVLLGKQTTIDRLKTLHPLPRPDLVRGFERAGDTAAQLVFSPSDDARRVFREMLPRLPDEIGGGSGKTLADGIQWASVSIQAPPRLSLSLVIQSRDADSAAALRGMIISALQLLTRAPDVRKHWSEVDDFARLMTPRLSGEQLLLNVSDKAGDMEQALRLISAPLQTARTAAGRHQSMNNLKHLGLAMHNHHDTHGCFPPQAIRSKDGKALLSWRVAILPYLEAEALYKEFHLDEPWDSEHNQKLIAKMPAVLASPGLGDERQAKGLTSYFVPLTRQPPLMAVPPMEDSKKPIEHGKDEMVFDLIQGASLARITDGTSNTILVLEANPKAAVVWTKPDDLVMDPNDLMKDLRGQPNDGFCTLFGDGSARFIKASIDPKTFLHLLQMNDGQPVGEF